MVRTPRIHSDEIDLVYMLRKHGCSELYVIICDEVYTFSITHIMSDPIADLIDLCCALIGGKDCWIKLYDEPGATLLCITVDKDQKNLIDLSIFTADGWESGLDEARLEFSVKMKASHLATLIIHQLYKTQNLCREKSYAKNRSIFPQQAFSNLVETWQRSQLMATNPDSF